MTVVKYGSKAWLLRPADLVWPTDRISNIRLNEKRGSIPLSRAIMRESLRWSRHVLQMKDDRLPKMSFSAIRLGLNEKQVVLGWGR